MQWFIKKTSILNHLLGLENVTVASFSSSRICPVELSTNLPNFDSAFLLFSCFYLINAAISEMLSSPRFFSPDKMWEFEAGLWCGVLSLGSVIPSPARLNPLRCLCKIWVRNFEASLLRNTTNTLWQKRLPFSLIIVCAWRNRRDRRDLKALVEQGSLNFRKFWLMRWQSEHHEE